jgi:peroxiredoxin-like protein
MMHTFHIQSSITQFQPLLGKLNGTSGALNTTFSLPAVWGGVPENTGTGELLAAAAAACYLITVNIAAEREKIELAKLEVSVEGDMTADRSGVRISELRLYPVIAVIGDAEQTEKMRQLALSCSSNCVISKAIAGNVAYTIHEPVME